MCAALAADVLAVWRARALLWGLGGRGGGGREGGAGGGPGRVWGVLVGGGGGARHAGTGAGLVWPYLQPLLTVAAYYLVFDVVFAMRLGAGAPAHAVGTFLIVGALPWMAFCDAVSRGMGSLIDAGSLLQKNALPPVLFATRAVLASAVIYGPLLLALALAYTPLHGWRPAVVAGL